jgi:hypothetical protein
LNNPLKYNDPDGHFNWQAALTITAIVVVAVVVTAAVIVAAPVVLTAAASAATFIGSGMAVGSTAAVTVASASLAAAEFVAPAAAAVAATPVLGTVATAMAGVGLASVGIGTIRPPSILPDTLYHYTDVGPEAIMQEGLVPPSGITYTTNLGSLNSQAAQTVLNTDHGRTLSNIYSIDVSAALESGATLSGPSWIEGSGRLPTGGWEWTFEGRIPPSAIDWLGE